MSSDLGQHADAINRRILIVDDNEMIHQDFTKILAPPRSRNEDIDNMAANLFGAHNGDFNTSFTPFDLASALQGEDGMRLVREARQVGTPFAMAFVDMRMPPGWDGLETIARIWEHDPEVQIVICTAYSDHSWDEIAQKLKHSSRLLILKKPFDSIEVLQLAHALTEKWSLAKNLRDHLSQLERLVDARTSDLGKTNQELSKEVAQHRQTIMQLVEVKLQVDRMLEVLPLALIGLDRDGVIGHWNAIAQDLFGTGPEQAVGSRLQDLELRVDRAELAAMINDACRGSPTAEREFRFVRANGQEGFLLAAAAPMPGAEGILLYCTEITHRRMLEAQLLQSQKLEAIGQLAAGVAHEINTPVQYIGDNLRFLKTAFEDLGRLIERYGALSGTSSLDASVSAGIAEAAAAADLPYLQKEVSSAIEQSAVGVGQISKIVSAMRDFSHPATQTRRWIGLANVIVGALNVSRNEYKYIADVAVDVPEDLPKISAYVVQLNQVILNLIVNAAHAIAAKGVKERGKITITARADGGLIELSIADTGCGIPERVRHHIFEPFFTTKPVGQGTGQGLYLSREIVVKHHGGDISFTSVVGSGTTFVLRLPIEGSGEGGGSGRSAPAQAR